MSYTIFRIEIGARDRKSWLIDYQHRRFVPVIIDMNKGDIMLCLPGFPSCLYLLSQFIIRLRIEEEDGLCILWVDNQLQQFENKANESIKLGQTEDPKLKAELREFVDSLNSTFYEVR